MMSTQYPKLNVLIRHGDISSKETFRRSAVHKAEKVCEPVTLVRVGVSYRRWIDFFLAWEGELNTPHTRFAGGAAGQPPRCAHGGRRHAELAHGAQRGRERGGSAQVCHPAPIIIIIMLPRQLSGFRLRLTWALAGFVRPQRRRGAALAAAGGDGGVQAVVRQPDEDGERAAGGARAGHDQSSARAVHATGRPNQGVPQAHAAHRSVRAYLSLAPAGQLG